MADHAYTPPRPTIITRRAIGAATALLALSGAVANAGERPGAGTFQPDLGQGQPDAALIALCAEVTIQRDRFNTEGTLDSDECPIWAAYTAAADAISDAKPQTMAGLVAKARAAKLESLDARGEEEPAGTMAERWAWDLVDDLIRLSGRVGA